MPKWQKERKRKNTKRTCNVQLRCVREVVADKEREMPGQDRDAAKGPMLPLLLVCVCGKS